MVVLACVGIESVTSWIQTRAYNRKSTTTCNHSYVT